MTVYHFILAAALIVGVLVFAGLLWLLPVTWPFYIFCTLLVGILGLLGFGLVFFAFVMVIMPANAFN